MFGWEGKVISPMLSVCARALTELIHIETTNVPLFLGQHSRFYLRPRKSANSVTHFGFSATPVHYTNYSPHFVIWPPKGITPRRTALVLMVLLSASLLFSQ